MKVARYTFSLIVSSLILLLNFGCSQKPYTITQYGDANGNQSMCYSIESPNGELIIIDGGYDTDAPKVRSIIENLGGRVDHWIITHPHPDHVGAFNVIFDDLQDVEIGEIYTIDMDYAYYKEMAQPWDDFAEYETFLEITDGYENLNYLYAGDELNISDLSMIVFNSAVQVADPANNGSLMFKITASSQSMLFCADVGEIMSESIMEEFEPQLKADYIQMGHHGNGGLSDAFYHKVSPDTAFFDAPNWLMDNIDPATGESGSWDTPENRALMESMGCTIYSFNAAPNSVELY